MNIYEPCVFGGDPCELKQLASHLVEHLLAGAVPISSPLDSDPVHLVFRRKDVLIQFVLFSRELGEEGFEILLDHVAKLEAKRGEQHDPTLQEIGICLAAPGFSQNFLSRVPFELVRITLIEWSLICSENQEAILVRTVRKGIGLDPVSPKIVGNEETKKSFQPSLRYSAQELSTPELITFSRFGMELRSRREQAKSAFKS